MHDFHGLAYSDVVLDSWSPVPDAKRVAWITAVIRGAEGQVLIAGANEIKGFCVFTRRRPHPYPLRSARPRACRNRAALLMAAEHAILEAGCMKAYFKAYLNAEGFYAKNGDTSIGPSSQALSNGTVMECIVMEQFLSSCVA